VNEMLVYSCSGIAVAPGSPAAAVAEAAAVGEAAYDAAVMQATATATATPEAANPEAVSSPVAEAGLAHHHHHHHRRQLLQTGTNSELPSIWQVSRLNSLTSLEQARKVCWQH